MSSNFASTYFLPGEPVASTGYFTVQSFAPFVVPSTGKTYPKVIVRSNATDRNKMARYMIFASDSDTSTPQLFLFPTVHSRDNYQEILFQDTDWDLQAYDLSAPVKITTHLTKGSNIIPKETYIIPNYPTESELYGDSYYDDDGLGTEYIVNLKGSSKKHSKRSSKRSKKSSKKSK